MSHRPEAFLPQLKLQEQFPIPLELKTRRLESIDILRGFLMIVMALDHTRDYFSNSTIDPTDPHRSWPLLFATRWITHLCAPGFIALAGTSVYLQLKRGKAVGTLQRLLLTRGLWLVFLEWTVIDFGWSFGWKPFLQVIWAVGISMMMLALVLRLRARWIGVLGVIITAGHNLLDPIRAQALGNFADLWKITHEPGMLMLAGKPVALEIYPVLPWFGVICLGYAWGEIVNKEPQVRRLVSASLGALLLLGFAILRLFIGYGDANRFERLDTLPRDLMSILNVQKYPPSLQYLLATLGVVLLAYVIFDYGVSRDWLPGARKAMEVFGRVPFFFYVIHIYLLHTLALFGTMALHLDWHAWLGHLLISPLPKGWGFGLLGVYIVWAIVVFVLYWPCVLFGAFKARRRDWWLSYL